MAAQSLGLPLQQTMLPMQQPQQPMFSGPTMNQQLYPRRRRAKQRALHHPSYAKEAQLVTIPATQPRSLQQMPMEAWQLAEIQKQVYGALPDLSKDSVTRLELLASTDDSTKQSDQLRAQGLYIPHQPYTRQLQRWTLKHRLQRQDPQHKVWCHPHTTQLVIQPSPLLHPSLRALSSREYIHSHPTNQQYQAENFASQRLCRQLATRYVGKEQWYTLHLQVHSLQFTTHALCTTEDLRCREIDNLYREYKRREQINLHQFYTQRLQQLRKQVITLTQQYHTDTSNTLLLQQLLHLFNELHEGRELRDREEYEQRMLFKKMYSKWSQVREWRSQQQVVQPKVNEREVNIVDTGKPMPQQPATQAYVGVPLVLRVKKVVMDATVDQHEWQSSLQQELEEQHRVYELARRLQQSNNASISDSADNWETVKAVMQERIESRMTRCRRLPGQPIYLPVVETNVQCTPTSSCAPAEQQRRKALEMSQYYIELYLNNQHIRTTTPTTLQYPSFALPINFTTELRMLSPPQQIQCKLYQQRILRDELLAEIVLPIPTLQTGKTSLQDTTATLQQYEFSGTEPLNTVTYDTSLFGQYIHGWLEGCLVYSRDKDVTQAVVGDKLTTTAISTDDEDDEDADGHLTDQAVDMDASLSHAQSLQQHAVEAVKHQLIKDNIQRNIKRLQPHHIAPEYMQLLDPNDPENVDVYEYAYRQQQQQKLGVAINIESAAPTFPTRGADMQIQLINPQHHTSQSRRETLLRRHTRVKHNKVSSTRDDLPLYDYPSMGELYDPVDTSASTILHTHTDAGDQQSGSTIDSVGDVVSESSLPIINYSAVDWISFLFNPSVHYQRLLNATRSWLIPMLYNNYVLLQQQDAQSLSKPQPHSNNPQQLPALPTDVLLPTKITPAAAFSSCRLMLQVIRAVNLPQRSNYTPIQPYVTAKLTSHSQTLSTYVSQYANSVAEVGVCHYWNMLLPLSVDSSMLYDVNAISDIQVVLTVYDRLSDQADHQLHLASATISLATILCSGKVETHLQLQSAAYMSGYQPASTSGEPTLWTYASFDPPINTSQPYPLARSIKSVVTTFEQRIDQWCAQTQNRYLYTQHRRYVGCVHDVYHQHLHTVCSYLTPTQPPAGFESPAMFTALVNTIPSIQSTDATNAHPSWCTNTELVTMRCGTMIDHALLLANFYAYHDALENSKTSGVVPTHHTYVVLGDDNVHGSQAAYVLRTIYSMHSLTPGQGLVSLQLIDPTTGKMHNLLDSHQQTSSPLAVPSLTLHTIHIVFDGSNIYLNIQPDGHPLLVSWNLTNYRMWAALYDYSGDSSSKELTHEKVEELYNYKHYTVQTPLPSRSLPTQYYTERSQQLETLCKQQFAEWRRAANHDCHFDDKHANALRPLLTQLEYHRQQQLTSAELDTKVRSVIASMSDVLYSTGVQLNDTGDADLLADEREANLLLQRLHDLKLHTYPQNCTFTVCCVVHPYAWKLGSVWLYVLVSR